MLNGGLRCWLVLSCLMICPVGGCRQPRGKEEAGSREPAAIAPQKPMRGHLTDAQLADLLRKLADADVYLRQEAARELGDARDPRAVDGLRRLLKEREDDVRTAAAEALGQIGPGASGATRDLILAASDVNGEKFPHSPDAATDALTKIGLSAVPGLVDALADDQSVAAAAFALGHMGPAVIPALTAALHGNSKTADGAAVAAGYLGDGGAPIVPELINALRERRLDGQPFAAAMQGIGQGAKRAVPQLIDLLNDENPGTRLLAANALVAMGDDARSAAPALKRALEREQDVGTRQKIQQALERLEK